MNRRLETALLGIALSAAAAGCQNDRSASTETHADRHPTPEGRVEAQGSAVLPVDVKAGVEREYPGSAVQWVGKRTYDDRVVRYEVHLQTKDGHQVTRVFDSDGRPSPAGVK